MLAVSFKLAQGEKKGQAGVMPSTKAGVVSIH